MLSVWQFRILHAVFLAALKQVPSHFYEAAKIDGAGPVRSFFKNYDSHDQSHDAV